LTELMSIHSVSGLDHRFEGLLSVLVAKVDSGRAT
jgi:hypothetical protein